MSRPTRLSIVITCYNYARYVGTAINSALAQTYPHVEVIVVDDGSTDRSAEVIARYGERVRSIRQANQGSIPAYNRGFAESRGDLVLFLDADDVAEPELAQRVVAAWHAGCAKVQYDLKIIDAGGADLGRRFCHFDSGYDAAAVRRSFERTGTYLWPVTAGNVYARGFLEAAGPLKVGIGPDGLLNTIAPLYGEVVTIRDALASYRLHGANMWSSNGLDLTRLPERIAARYRELDELASHARARGIALPAGDPLDHELAFVNYRLMALRLGQTYPGRERDSAYRLWRTALRHLATQPLPPKQRAVHGIWISVLWLAPRPLAAALIRLRFRRAELLQPLRRRFAAWCGTRERGSAPPVKP
ncbi:MAG TPA: glycosyltransferase family A protein [Burkholderiaceae bacterium]